MTPGLPPWLPAAALAAGAYLLGSVPAGLVLTRLLTGVDVRAHGSGNIGTVNVARVAGWGVGLVVLVVDALKGALPLLAAGRLGLGLAAGVAGAVAAVVGHNWSVFLRGRGGKGVATSLGAVVVLSPRAAALLVALWLVAAAVTRYASVGSVLAYLASPLVMRLAGGPPEAVAFCAVVAAMGVWRHRDNLRRLLRGEENPIGGLRRRPPPVDGAPRP